MKRILLIGSLLLFTGAVTYSQAQQNSTTRPVSMTIGQFNPKVTELNTLVGKKKIDDANAVAIEIQHMMEADMRAQKYKIRDANEAHNEADKAHNTELMKNKISIYTEYNNLKTDLASNQAKVNGKLKEYAATLN